MTLANDGPVDEPHVEMCQRVMEPFAVSATGGPRVGIGGSLNRALQFVRDSDQWLYCTDDWVLTHQYDLWPATLLIKREGYDYVRLGPPHPNIVCQTKFQQGLGWWLELWPKGGGFAFGTRPFIATKQFYDKIGPFKENCDAYVCERDYSDRVTDMWSHVRMAEVVSGSLEGPWKHIGEVSVGETFP